MELLICVLNDTDSLHDVVAGLMELGIGGGTVIESQGMGKILSQDIPIFAGFRHLMSGSRPFNYTILSVVDDKEMADDAVRMVRDILSVTSEKHKGVVFTLPVSNFEKL